MAELTSILIAKREKDYEDKKFMASLQGVDLGGKSDRGQKEWEDMKARVFSGGSVKDSSDIVSLQGPTAQKAGFGIGRGLEYKSNPKNPMG
jgi:translation initiation factor 1 (eIF-1/SUI1)